MRGSAYFDYMVYGVQAIICLNDTLSHICVESLWRVQGTCSPCFAHILASLLSMVQRILTNEFYLVLVL